MLNRNKKKITIGIGISIFVILLIVLIIFIINSPKVKPDIDASTVYENYIRDVSQVQKVVNTLTEANTEAFGLVNRDAINASKKLFEVNLAKALNTGTDYVSEVTRFVNAANDFDIISY